MNEEIQQMTQSGTYISLTIEEYNRLKQVEENYNETFELMKTSVERLKEANTQLDYRRKCNSEDRESIKNLQHKLNLEIAENARLVVENKRLKRLDENVKKLIEEGKIAIAVNSLTKKYSESDQQIWKNIINLLESLYDDTTQTS